MVSQVSQLLFPAPVPSSCYSDTPRARVPPPRRSGYRLATDADLALSLGDLCHNDADVDVKVAGKERNDRSGQR